MQVIDRAFVRGLMPSRDQGGHKGTFGKVYLLGGSVGYTGAPVLCAGGAVHSGCGLVFLGVPETVWPIAAARCLCAMPHPLVQRHGRHMTAIHRRADHQPATGLKLRRQSGFVCQIQFPAGAAQSARHGLPHAPRSPRG